MIFVDRSRLDENGLPIRPSEKWFVDAKAATDKMLADGKPADFDEELHRGSQPKNALEELFYRKCAYCESPLPEREFDVEHFRPKGRVKESPGHPGYYWLAYTWENLFPSCKPCNQNRKDHPTYTDAHAGPSAGKLDQFPLKDESKRAQTPDTVPQEEPLLLNPCEDNPEKHLLYGPGGLVFPAANSEKGQASIQVFHLFRKRLRDRRKKRLSDLAETFHSGGPTAQFTRDDSEFAGMCRHALRDPIAFGFA